jgi:ATP-dependent RNA helicase RhlE
VIFGGVSQNPQTSQLKAGADVLIATPGRLLDLMGQGFISLKQTDMFVLDEADRMLDMGFIPDVRRIAAKLPAQRQTLLFSATMPGEIARLAQKMLRNPVEINVSPISRPVELIEQRVYLVDKENKANLLAHLVKELPIPQALVFTRTKHGADRVARRLNREGVSAQAIHGDKSQSNRQRALQNFKDWKIQVLVATDIAARGIDIVEMPCVVNYDMPTEPETYVHRIGRTGRAGQSGMAISFCDEEEKAILRDVEMVIDKLLDIDYDNPFPLGSYVPDPNKPAPVRQGGRGRSGARRQEKPREQKGERPKTAASAAGGGPEAGHTARKRRRRPRRKPGASPERQA